MKAVIFQYSRMISTVMLCGMLAVAIGGCEKKEKVLDIKAPGMNIEVNRTSSGKQEVEIRSKDKLEIDTSK